MKRFVLVVFIGFTWGALAQIGIHSHNDYAQPKPLFGALEAHASSIEVDVILKDSILYVAHEFESIDSTKTLQSAYLGPLLQLVLDDDPRFTNLYLLIDIKTEAYQSLEAVIGATEAILPFTYPSMDNGIRLVISGNRPSPKDYLNYPDYLFFDCQEIDQTPIESWSKVAMISQSFRRFSNWNGEAALSKYEHERLTSFINRAKTFGKPVRLWAVPDTPKAWNWSIESGLDYINTDQPLRVREFLESAN